MSPSSTKKPHLVVIGSGSGGLTAAIGLSRLGRRVVLVEAGDVGGDCTNLGCIPSKTLLDRSARFAATGRNAPGDAAAVLAEVRAARDAFRDHETVEVAELPGIDLVRGKGRLVDGGVEITGPDGTRRVECRRVVLATGSHPRRLDIAGLPDDRRLTNAEVFDLEAVPPRLAIVGGGAVGVEFATAFARLGTAVTLIEVGEQLLPGLLPEAAGLVAAELGDLGVDVRLGARAASWHDGMLALTGPDGRATAGAEVGADRVLLGVGRIPATADLGLAEVGVEVDEAGHIVVDERGRTTATGVWACGDATVEGRHHGTTHAANALGRRIVADIVSSGRLPGGWLHGGGRPLHPSATFGHPETARIGHQSPEPGPDVVRHRVDLAATDRGITDQVGAGVLIVDVRRLSGRIVGATIVGPRAAELVSIFALALRNDLPLHRFYGVVWPYPSHADAIGRVVDLHVATTAADPGGNARAWLAGRWRALRCRHVHHP